MTGNINIHGGTGVDIRRIEQIANDAKTMAGKVSKEQLGIDKVDNTADIDKPVSIAQQAALDAKANVADFSAHKANSDMHITPGERDKWNTKANASHGTHVTYSNSPPQMDGAVSAGYSNAVARSDHVHPTDTSRAAASHTHSASSLTGTLSSDQLPTIPVSKGGTGAASAADARANLGAFSSSGGTISGAVDITGAVDIKNNSVHIGSGNSGGIIKFGDGDLVHIGEPSDNQMELKAKSIRFTHTSITESDSPLPVKWGGTEVSSLVGSDYSVNRVRGMKFASSTPASVDNGCVVLVYV